MKSILLLILLTLLTGCGTLSLTGSNCREPVLTSNICSVSVDKKHDDKAMVHVAYVHTGEYGKMVRIVAFAIGEGRKDIVGSVDDFYAYPGRHSVIIPISFYGRNDGRKRTYTTDTIRVEFRWIDEPVNLYGGTLMARDVPFYTNWIQDSM